MIQIPSDFKEFLKLLNSQSVEYMLIGGYAVGYYGYPRPTGDMDIWIARNNENVQQLMGVLTDFGFDLSDVSAELFMQPDQIIRMGVPPLRLEIITSISGRDFSDCYPRRIVAEMGDVMVSLIGFDDLIENKKASGRHKDIDDLEKLS